MKIESGCLAIVIDGDNPGNIGKITKVGDFIGQSILGTRFWEVDTQMIAVCGTPNYFQIESNLSRINDKEPDNSEFTEQELLEETEA